MYDEHHWYSIRVRAGKEQAAKRSILNLIEDEGLHNEIAEVIVPTEDIIEVRQNSKNKKKSTVERPLYSGYVFAKMKLDKHNILLSKIRSLSFVSGFVGDGKRPTPLSKQDIQKILDKTYNRAAPRPKVEFVEGEEVRIIEGSFANFTGIVRHYNLDKGVLELDVKILGRITPVKDIRPNEVEKIEDY